VDSKIIKNKQHKIKNKILVNCLKLGKNPKFTNKKLTQYIYGTRNNIDLFNITELQSILWRIYPFIKTLFRNYQLNYLTFKGRTQTKNIDFFSKKKTFIKSNSNKTLLFWPQNKYTNFFVKIPPIQILFATTTPTYITIIKSAAKRAQMPFHAGKWLPGSITVRSADVSDIQTWRPLINKNIKKFTYFFQNKHDKNLELLYRQPINNLWKENKFVSLIIIPDISKSYMIIKESRILAIPVVGITNSDELDFIDYPLLGNSTSIFLVNFFCQFLANLISKQTINKRHNWFYSSIMSSNFKNNFTQQKPIEKPFQRKKKTSKICSFT